MESSILSQHCRIRINWLSFMNTSTGFVGQLEWDILNESGLKTTFLLWQVRNGLKGLFGGEFSSKSYTRKTQEYFTNKCIPLSISILNWKKLCIYIHRRLIEEKMGTRQIIWRLYCLSLQQLRQIPMLLLSLQFWQEIFNRLKIVL